MPTSAQRGRWAKRRPGLVGYADHDAVAAVLANGWGLGSRSAEIVALAAQKPATCLG